MIGILLIFLSASFRETSLVMGKDAVEQHKQTLYANAFLAVFMSTVVFGCIVIATRDSIIFDFASLPTLGMRIFLEAALLLCVINAVVVADRTTVSFVRIMTIPLLLIVDTVLGYEISSVQYIGIILILVLLAVSFLRHTLARRGVMLALFSALLGVCTATLYKFNIEHYNSVALEQFIVLFFMLLFTMAAMHFVSHEPINRLVRNVRFLSQSLFMGISTILLSYALAFLAPVVAITAKRSFGVLIATFSGLKHYHEDHRNGKIALACGMVCGIILLAF